MAGVESKRDSFVKNVLRGKRLETNNPPVKTRKMPPWMDAMAYLRVITVVKAQNRTYALVTAWYLRLWKGIVECVNNPWVINLSI
jgi:hypothetical protein